MLVFSSDGLVTRDHQGSQYTDLFRVPRCFGAGVLRLATEGLRVRCIYASGRRT